ncbi:DUF4293 family protein [Blattabacterium cuenoti]|uniref:DUF4293 family protein n=1 Tax=Blattabacterium cuenoti TaxID=1653831 RepID=UPI00163D3965|nr:DUF4293 family protein [Blattabacterium cuenoti]
MLYRIQTLYLLISIFIYSIFIYFLKSITDFYNLYRNKMVLIFLIICLFLSILSLIFFKKQRLQIFFNKINILANTIHIFIFFFSYFQLNKYTFIVFLFFILCIYILYLSNRAIKKDIELIDSINRIR